MRSLSVTILLLALAACSDAATSASPPDAGSTGDASPPRSDGGGGTAEDAGADAGEPPLTEQEEKEPNNGSTETELNPMTLPGVMKGALDPADDLDIFSIAPAPGELWEWTLAPTGAGLSPHLAVFDADTNNAVNPTVLAKAAPGQPAVLQHFVLGAGKLVAAVRDARNVPTPSGQGGPTHGYTLTAKKKTPAPVPITLSSTKQGKLASLSSLDLYSFTLPASTDLDVIVRAAQKVPPSTLDSRVSIFSVTAKKSLGTNDDAGGGTTDSKLGGTLPAGSYLVLVDNEGTNDADLSYEIELAPR